MDVMKPDLQWIDGICYRINPVNFGNFTNPTYESFYEQETVADTCPLEIIDDDEEGIVEEGNGRFKATFHVAQAYFAYLIGSKGATKRNLEVETRTQVFIPKQGRDGDIVVTGASRRNVASARTRIQLMVRGARNRKKPTHFISLPLTHSSFKEGFLAFKAAVLETCKDNGIDETIFINENKLHLTITVLVICDDYERQEATNALKSCEEKVVQPLLMRKPLKLKMSGLDYMNDDPASVNVLYANVFSPEDPTILQTLLDRIKEVFMDLGTMKPEQRDDVKIHATVMNTVYRSNDEDTRETFDARNVLFRYGNYTFGEAVISHIDLSVMYTQCVTTGYYTATSSINLPI